MMMMKGWGRESGDGEIGRTPEQPARPRGSGAGLAGGGGLECTCQCFLRKKYWVSNAVRSECAVLVTSCPVDRHSESPRWGFRWAWQVAGLVRVDASDCMHQCRESIVSMRPG